MRALAPLCLAAVMLLPLGGCDGAGLDDFEEEVVVSAVLTVGAPLPLIHLGYTVPIDGLFLPVSNFVEGADITVSLLAPDGSVEAAFPYTNRDEGDYLPDSAHVVLSDRRYRLDIRAPGYPDPIVAVTTTPVAFEVVRPPPSPVVYQQGGSPTLDVTPSGAEGRPAVYVFTLEALDPSAESLTPFAAELFNERDVGLEDLVKTSSPLLNEGNYQQNPDGTVRIEVPWFGFNFYGPNRVTITALDEVLATFLEFTAIQFVPTTISPGEIPNVPTNVENGQGVFGAVAQVAAELVVERP